MRSKAWLATCGSLRLARLPRTASSAQRSRRLRFTRAAAPVLLAHAEVTKSVIYISVGPKLRYPAVVLIRNTTSTAVIEGLALPRASHSGKIALIGSRRPRCALAVQSCCA